MTYKQVKPFDTLKGGRTAGFCLRNVRLGYGIPALYDSAWTAWLKTQQHTGTPPSGVDVPVYFSYTASIDGIRKNWGHIGVRLKDGRFWSDGKVYPSISDYTSNFAPVYVGWGESVNNVRVIEGEEMYEGKTAEQWQRIANEWHAKYEDFADDRQVLVAKVAQLESRIAEITKALAIKDGEIERLKAQVGDSTKWQTFKALIKELIS